MNRDPPKTLLNFNGVVVVMEIKKENKSDLRFEQEDDAVWVFSGDSHQGTEITHLIMSHIDDYNEDDVRLICHYAANEIDRLRAKLAKATPEGFVLVPKELSDEKAIILAHKEFSKISSFFYMENKHEPDSSKDRLKRIWIANKIRNLKVFHKTFMEAQEQSHD